MSELKSPILILGAGINGAAIARELALTGVSVLVVDTNDLAFGTTAYSSRLIHGGLRYLEYGEFDLVRESLAERTRLLRLAPQYVRPLKLFIPVTNRFGGLISSAARFLGLGRGQAAAKAASRGLWLVRLGLQLYDIYARDPTLPKHATVRSDRQSDVKIDPEHYPWLCSYYDAQIRFPERFVVALLDDARRAAAETGASFELYNYHRAELKGRTVEIFPVAGVEQPVMRLEPAAIINATGAWVDRTLAQLHVQSKTLMAGTKGSHFVTSNPRLRAALGDHGMYVEAADGRPLFVLPLGDVSLVGTTDLPFEGDPADAVASPAELDYLLETVNSVIPNVNLSRADIELHYSGVRPLPFVGPSAPAAVTRRHWIEENRDSVVLLYSIIGGKLTTCRSLAEESTAAIRNRLGLAPGRNSRERLLPGAEAYPASEHAVEAECRRLTDELGLTFAQVQTVWRLRGAETTGILKACLGDDQSSLVGSDLPAAFARWSIRNEWVRRLDDLVERRLMLLYDRRLSRGCLRQLAAMLVEAGLLGAEEAESEVERVAERLKSHFGKQLGGWG